MINTLSSNGVISNSVVAQSTKDSVPGGKNYKSAYFIISKDNNSFKVIVRFNGFPVS